MKIKDVAAVQWAVRVLTCTQTMIDIIARGSGSLGAALAQGLRSWATPIVGVSQASSAYPFNSVDEMLGFVTSNTLGCIPNTA